MESLSVHDKTVLNTIFDPLHFEGGDLFSEENIEDKNAAEELEDDLKELLKEAIGCAEKGRFDDAFRLFDEALDKMPDSPTILNDRAQALRLASRNEEALAHLNEAIKLSAGRGKPGVQALCQRALLYRRLGQEEKAKQDFEEAAKAGSKFAKSQLVALNPYAALCNAMLQKVFTPTTE